MSDQLDIKELRIFFSNVKCSNVVRLIDYLDTPAGKSITQLGSGTIDIAGLSGISIQALSTESLRIGTHRREKPLQALYKIMARFDELKAPEVFLLDEVCREFLRILSVAEK